VTTAVHLLDNAVQHYGWGSSTRIHELLGTEPDGRPAAELWLGAHPSAPSTTADGVALDALVRSDPEAMLGRRVSDAFGPRLPFLLKVLAAERALSLQVHPRPHAARAGFNRENRLGLPPGSPQRSFHDDQHKPELVVAVSQFEGLAGFRAPRAILALLQGLDGPLVAAVRDILAADRSDRGMKQAFARLLAARRDPACRADIDATVASVQARLAAGSPYDRADATVLQLAEQHPGDPGAIASLMLNRVTLEPGEAMFMPAGQVHAYLSGVGIEIMASSDNVLRAGLTTKLVDEAALVECATFTPAPPVHPALETAGNRGQVHSFRAPVDEFALTVADVDAGEAVALPAEGPRVVLCLEGKVALEHGEGQTVLRHGESVFVPHATGAVTVSGEGQLVCAWVP
jgi:mannose-6-phosphate isomerase